MKNREEIADALYLVRAGTDPDTFLRVLRTYVLQHTETREQMAALVQDLAAVDASGFIDAVNTMVGRPLKAPDSPLRAIIDGDGYVSVKHVKHVKVAKPSKRSAKHTPKRAASKRRNSNALGLP